MPRPDYTPPTFTDVPQAQWGSPPPGAVPLDSAHVNAMAQAIGNSVPASGASSIDGAKTFTSGPIVRDTIQLQGFVNYGNPTMRIPFNNSPIIDGSVLTSANPSDKVGMQNSVTFKGGFSGEAVRGTSNPGFLWGANDFIISGAASGDLAGATDFYGRLIETHAQAPGTNLNVMKVLQVEGHLEPAATGGRIGSLYGIYVIAPRNGGTIDNAYGIYIEPPTTATTNWALFVNGQGKSYFGGDIQMNADPSQPHTLNAYNGKLIGRGIQVGQPSDLPTGALLGVKTAADSDVALWLQGRGGQSGDLLRVGQNTGVSARFDKNGRLALGSPFAPGSTEVNTGEVFLTVDGTAGAMKLIITGKDNGGTMRSATVALA